MSRGLLVALPIAVAVAGCLPTRPGLSGRSERTCLAENPRFADAWACARARLLAREDAAGTTRNGLVEEGDLLAEQVKAGKVSEAEARKRLGSGIAHEADP